MINSQGKIQDYKKYGRELKKRFNQGTSGNKKEDYFSVILFSFRMDYFISLMLPAGALSQHIGDMLVAQVYKKREFFVIGTKRLRFNHHARAAI